MKGAWGNPMETVTVELLKMEGFQLDFCVGSLVKCKLSEE